ncbi:MAG: primosomal protein N', partial [Acetobacteraceae bacterium]|nr:primosomal protein N' [Acetobacteraceae bacterium]
MTRIACVLLPLPLPEAFDYVEPEGMDLAVGELVVVPLGPNQVQGVVLSLKDGRGHNRPLKPVLARYDEPALPPNTLEFVQWAARYAVDAPGMPLAIALRGARAPKPRPEKVVVATGAEPKRPTPARSRVLAAVADQALAPAQLAERAGVSSGVVKGLVDEGVLAVEVRETVS